MNEHAKSVKRRFITQLCAKHWPVIALLILCFVVTSIARSIGAQYIQTITDHIQRRGLPGLWPLVGFACAMQVLHYVTKFFSAVLCQYLNGKLRTSLRLRLMRHYQHMPLLAFEGRSVGQYLTILRNDTLGAAEYIYIVFSRIGLAAFTSVALFAFMLAIDWGLTLCVLAVSIGFGLVNRRILENIKRYEGEARAARGDLSATAMAGFEAADSLKVYGARDYIKHVFLRHRGRLNRAAMNVTQVEAIRLSLYTVVNNATMYGTICFLAWRALRGQSTLGDALAYSMLLTQALVSVEMIFRWLGQVVRSNASWERIAKALEGEDPTGGLPASFADVDTLEVQEISFAYGGRPLLDRMTVKLERGKLYGVRGESGSGKSTLLKCLLGLYDVPGARFLVNRKQIPQREASGLFAFVPSEHFLFAGTLYDNLALGNGAITHQACLDAAESLGIAQWLSDLPGGLAYGLTEKGENLSGGQRQMLCILRAVLSGRPVLVLDEPFSALDEAHANALAALLSKLKDERIVLFTSHRVDPLSFCDVAYQL